MRAQVLGTIGIGIVLKNGETAVVVCVVRGRSGVRRENRVVGRAEQQQQSEYSGGHTNTRQQPRDTPGRRRRRHRRKATAA